MCVCVFVCVRAWMHVCECVDVHVGGWEGEGRGKERMCIKL